MSNDGSPSLLLHHLRELVGKVDRSNELLRQSIAVQREIAREPGDIRRISVAVLLNGVRSTGADGTVTLEPRPPEEVATLEDDMISEGTIGVVAEVFEADGEIEAVFDNVRVTVP